MSSCKQALFGKKKSAKKRRKAFRYQMIFAVDENGDRVHIDYTVVGRQYFCPLCGEQVVRKLGNIRKHHFSHIRNTVCSDSWHYDMSEWHRSWQNFFPEKYQEIVFSGNGEKHRADISVDNMIIEFQHSLIPSVEFYERNAFYHSIGKKVIWVFDANDRIDYSADDISNSIESSMLSALKTTSNIFTDKSIRDSADLIFLCVDYPEQDQESDDQIYNLMQVSWFWVGPKSKTKIVFGVDQWMDNIEFVETILEKQENERTVFEGTIPFLWRKNRIKKWAIFEDEEGFRVKISSDPKKTYEKYGQLYGYFSAPNRYQFNSESKRVVGMKCWKFISGK